MAQKKYKVFDKRLLQSVNDSSIRFQYNRTLDPEFIALLPDEGFFPVVFTMLHEHRAGKACEPHVRVMIAIPRLGETVGLSERILLDVNMDLFDVIPEIGVPENDPEATPVAG